MSSVVANRYARALLEALAPDRAQEGRQQLESLHAVFQQHPDIEATLENPAFPLAARTQLVRALGDRLGFDRRVANLLGLLIERKRLRLLGDINSAYQRLYDERMGMALATVTSAAPLAADEQHELAAKLRKLTGKEIRLEVHVDPDLIGGVIARVGSTVYDGSVRQHLRSFKNRFVGR